MRNLSNRDVVVFGISADTVELHNKFAQSERLNFPLLSDVGKKMIQDYGVLGPGGLPKRVTFLIGPDGTIVGIDGQVDAQFTKQGSTLVSRHGANLALLLSDWKARLGAPVPNFFLANYDGKTVSALPPDKKAAVIVFLGAKCPASRAAGDALRSLALHPIYQDVAFLGIASNADETVVEARALAKMLQLPFPLARDPGSRIADRFGVTETPTVWVLDERGVAVYHGAVTGSAGGRGVDYVREALDAVLTGRPVPLAATPVSGTAIKRPLVR